MHSNEEIHHRYEPIARGGRERDRDRDRDREHDMYRADDRSDERGWSQRGDEFSERDRDMYGRGESSRRDVTGYGYDEGSRDNERMGYYGNSGRYGHEDRQLGWQRGMGGQGARSTGESGRYSRSDWYEPMQQQRGPHYGKGPQSFQRSDERIKEQVNEALTDHGDIDATHVDVQVKNGEVTLTGTVEDRRMKRLAEDCVERVAGVRDVQNQLKIGTGRAERGMGTDSDKQRPS